MIFRYILIFLIAFLPFGLNAQMVQITCILADSESHLPIQDAHLFFNNSSFGNVSNQEGRISLEIPQGLREDVVISHISYDPKIIQSASYRTLQKKDTIFLSPNGIQIEEIVIAKKRSKKWKKNLKKFTKAFLGNDKIASKCKILNPEVLRFDDRNDQFKTTAIDLIEIQNDHLGYRIYFLLDNLNIDKNGSIKYIGNANFIDISTSKNRKKITKNRITAFEKSPSHFFQHLIQDNLKKGKYNVTIAKYAQGTFNEVRQPEYNEMVYYDSTSQNYFVSFQEFLQIEHLGIKEYKNGKYGISAGQLESRRFNTREEGPTTKSFHPKSWLYKIMPQLIVDKYGNIKNQRAVQEYGYWAMQRMAHKLPLDYNIDFEDFGEFQLTTKTQNENTRGEQPNEQKEPSSLSHIQSILSGNNSTAMQTLSFMDSHWKDSFAPPLLDVLRIVGDSKIKQRILDLLSRRYQINNYYEGLQWLWEQEEIFDSLYAETKAEIYQLIDPKFSIYFKNRQSSATINMDEIVWGGVKQDGIPPLRNPSMIVATEATYLSDSDIVFGIAINGDQRAYPKRILAWHEFFVDTIGGRSIAGVYCTLCGTMIAYDMNHKGTFYDLGTSGFLYRSNKLMYDARTQSLWSTIEGRPVLGPLTCENITLQAYPTITTTWGEWKRQYPTTKVLSLDTGHSRNYNEGEAYKDYFATDKLMFPVPEVDRRLRNKDEVLIIRTDNFEEDPLAISIQYLREKPIVMGKIAGTSLVVISKKDDWVRVYEADTIQFESYQNNRLIDQDGNYWTVQAAYLQGPDGRQLKRISSHRSFWFAWYNAYPTTRLLH
ncbi:MAG: DUF3179 domain-containing (seleno)protein [Saprospiraceae bacterium]|nr:DUF3179 domain-containing (seleno)protein [Saprospiraceae bacterium]